MGSYFVSFYASSIVMGGVMKQTSEFRKLAENILHKEVYITEIATTGTVVSVFIGDYGVQYNVRYFLNGDAKTVYMFDHEITQKGDIF